MGHAVGAYSAIPFGPQLPGPFASGFRRRTLTSRRLSGDALPKLLVPFNAFIQVRAYGSKTGMSRTSIGTDSAPGTVILAKAGI